MKTTLFFIILFLTLNSAFTQVLDETIYADYKNESLRQILANLNEKYEINFTYATHNLPLDKMITIRSNGQPLKDFLNELLLLADLEYRIFHDYVAINKKASEVKGQQNMIENHNNLHEKLSASRNPAQINKVIADTESTPSETLIPMGNKGLGDIGNYQSHDNTIQVYSAPDDKFTVNKEIARNSHFDISILFSFDYFHLHGDSRENENFNYQSKLNYSTGLSGRVKLLKDVHLNLQVLYSTKDFELNYNFQSSEQEDPYLPTRTKYDLTFLEFPLFINYNFAKRNNWELTAETGMIYSFLMERNIQTYVFDNSSTETPLFLTGSIRDELFSLQLGIRMRYHLKNRLSLHLTPAYRYYLKSINYDGPPVRADMIQCSFGLMYSF